MKHLILLLLLFGTMAQAQPVTVYKISTAQADSLRGHKMPNGSVYNVDVKDKNGNVIISKEQYFYCRIGEEIIYEPIETDEDEE